MTTGRRLAALTDLPPDFARRAGCWHHGEHVGAYHRWEANSPLPVIDHGQGPLCIVCGLPFGTWLAEQVDAARTVYRLVRDDPKSSRSDEMVALTRIEAAQRLRPVAYHFALEVPCPLRSCRAVALHPCTTRGAARYAGPHGRRIRVAELAGYDEADA